MKEKKTENQKYLLHSIKFEKFLLNKTKSLFFIKEYKDIIDGEKRKEELLFTQLDDYFYRKNQTIQIKNNEIVSFLKSNGINGWQQHPNSQSRWIYLPDETIARKFEEILRDFCKKYCLCNDKKQISRVIYFFELCFARTLAKKYQTSVKKIFSSKIVQKKGYLLLYNEKHNNYQRVFCKKKFYCYFVM